MANRAYSEEDLEPVLTELDRQIKKYGSCYIKQLCVALEPQLGKREQTLRNLIDFGIVNGYIVVVKDPTGLSNRKNIRRKTQTR